MVIRADLQIGGTDGGSVAKKSASALSSVEGQCRLTLLDRGCDKLDVRIAAWLRCWCSFYTRGQYRHCNYFKAKSYRACQQISFSKRLRFCSVKSMVSEFALSGIEAVDVERETEWAGERR